MGYKWKPLERASFAGPRPESEIKYAMEIYGLDREAAIAKLKAYDDACEVWRNDLYQVQTRRFLCEGFQAEMLHINIRRCDGAAVFDWRHRQLIKNQLAGDQCEAFELYPAESRLVDTSNKYHLWAFLDPTVRLPVGIDRDGQRDVIEEEVRRPSGVRQRGIA